MVAATATAAGCGTKAEPPAASKSTPTASPSPTPPTSPTPPSSPSAGPSLTTTTKPRTSTGWEITVYYTAVEDYHDGTPTPVTGCPTLNCKNGTDNLGTYPADFVQAVQDEGTGRTSSGTYLNWSYDIGYWLDSVPRTSDGQSLSPFVSAAADPDVLPHGTRFTIAACGTQDDGSTPPSAVCAALKDASWEITDEFTPGLGGSRHIDAYIGPETGEHFTDSDWYITLTGARISIG
ncbi:hypothetical protein ADL15_50455 [Actinoplanes awajinensis subsp. mycoplanecinus]|uniref:Uncharacterized protein n=2 Tax=Actinoplanes awajinensis TaxID=135946 RepID=A0A101J793_9ACTN|nr:hypothetical protein ADL15_50455 [Actinoplanes awajinensis subsp. mycoplanecinus]